MIRILGATAALLVYTSLFAEVAHVRITTNQGHHSERTVQFADRTRIIVELEPQPQALARFRSDVARLRTRIATNGTRAAAPIIRHEYALAFHGAALELPRKHVDDIRALPYVRAIHPDVTMHALQLAPIDFGTDAAARVDATNLGTRGRGVTIAVLDTGIDYKHAAFGGGFGPGFKVAGGWDFISNDPDPMDDGGHGTHVAGIAAADGGGLIGVAPEATLIAYKVLDSTGSGPTSGIIAAIERAMDPNGDGDTRDHVDIMNISLGAPGHPDDAASQAVDRAVAAGVVVIAAAGNTGRVMTIGSPGAARSAITVAAYDQFEQIAFFSSKGPASKTYGYKPDISAPGNEILSAKMGGGIVTKSGTSMAAPHVSGAAALIKALHPDWTPAEVKSALTGTARALKRNSNPYAGGAGRLHVADAVNARLLASTVGVSFGLNASSSGTWDESRVVQLTNRSNAVANLQVSNVGAPAGITMNVTPATLRLEPGQSGEVTLRASSDNTKLAYPNSLALFSQIRIADGDAGVNVSWALLRAARAVFTYDRPFNGTEGITLFSADAVIDVVPDGATAEAILPAGRYDAVLQGFDEFDANNDPHAMRIVVAENLQVAGEKTFPLRGDAAVHTLEMNAVDDQGRSLLSLPAAHETQEHLSSARLNFVRTENGSAMDVSMGFTTPTVRKVLVSPLSATFKLFLSQTYLDAEQRRGYTVAHPLRVGVSGDAKLTNDPSQFLHATVRARYPHTDFPRVLGACIASDDSRQFGTNAHTYGCVIAPASGDETFDVWTTADAGLDSHVGVMVTTGTATLPPIRAFGGEIVLTRERTPSGRDARVANHGEITLGLAPAYPFAIDGTAGPMAPMFPGARVMGPYGEDLTYANAALYTMRDERDQVVATGVAGVHLVPPTAKPGYRYTATIDALHGRERRSRGELEVRFGSRAEDVIAPMITSLSIRNASGKRVDTLARGEASTLYFSAGDFEMGVFPRYADGNLTAARASYRVSGTAAWLPLTLITESTERRDRSETGHWPAGVFYRAELAPVSHDAQLDLRIELEDVAGNRVVWTQERALVVGTLHVPSARKRRASR